MASGCDWFYKNVTNAKAIANRTRIGQSIMRHSMRYTAGAGVAGAMIGHASGSRGISGRSSGGSSYTGY